MRYDTPIYFQRTETGEYDSNTGDYGPDKVVETKKYANATEASVDTLNLIYGELRQGSYVIRLQRQYDQPFDRIRIGRKTYRVDFSKNVRNGQVFVASEAK